MAYTTFFCFFVLFFTSVLCDCPINCPTNNNRYLIRHPLSGLVVDSTNGILTVQNYSGTPPQQWKFRPGNRPGLNYIVSSIEKVLAVATNDYHLFLVQQSDSLQRQWYINSNGNIVNAASGQNLDIQGAVYVTGNPVIVYGYTGTDIAPNEKFAINEEFTCCKSCVTLVN